jgi:hypothetical protein
MIPAPGQHIKIFFKNGLIEEGIVDSWSDNSSTLKSLESNNILIVQNCKENIIAIKILVDVVREEVPKEVKQQQPHQTIASETVIDLPNKNYSLRVKKLAELHELKRKQELENVRQHLTTFESKGLQQVTYGHPTRLQKPPESFNNPRKEAFKRIKENQK